MGNLRRDSVSETVDLFALLRYVLLDPLHHGLARDLESLEARRWCGYGALMGRTEAVRSTASSPCSRGSATRASARPRARDVARARARRRRRAARAGERGVGVR